MDLNLDLNLFDLNPNADGNLLMISDLEGCPEFDNANTVIDESDPEKKIMQVPQTQILCNESTFNSLDKFLKKNDKKNKVAFLGDYFDKGPHVITSINKIVELYENNKDQVHIILGNRDVNKLRLIYELDPDKLEKQEITENTENNLIFKNEFIKGFIDEKDPFKRLILILKNTMSAGPPTYDKEKNIALQIKKIEDDSDDPTTKEENEKYLAKILVSVFNETVADKISNRVIDDNDEKFIENCRKLFEYAKIVHYDDDFKVLLSHAGGFTNTGSHILSDINFYDDIINEMGSITNDNYFIKINETQKKLIKPIIKKENIQEKSLSEVLKFHNNLLKTSITDILGKNLQSGDLPSKEYILLQAMGLNGSDYYSFIASCGLNGGCKLVFNKNEELLKKMQENGIKFVASGHQPHCTTVPLIYKQGDIVFIANDTSNGYRPENNTESRTELKLENIPLSYIERNTFECGVCAINDNGNLVKGNDPNNNNPNKNIKAFSKDGKDPDYYNKLIKIYNNTGSVPTVDDIKQLLKPNSDEQFKPLIIMGGKRKSKKHRYTKNQKKHSNKTKKHRKSKKTCHHCKMH